MSNSGAFYQASNVGGKIEKTQVKSAVKKQVLSLSHLLLSHFRSGFVLFYDLLLNYIVLKCSYEKYHVGGDDEERKANYTDMGLLVNDLWKWESLRESIKRHEHFLALQLGLKKGQKVLDVGCGIGGPLREIARFR
ncbi:hypothetical protein POTOM_051491 [Populus tomentosa]|uniref:Uncharacterized protein n=1 Tax=Populus tomentosa TaxID=118781 RepID=A0A8X7Y5N6_POPTO|nr:hypothetical protein POTOM_051491 [Populus tomentosa]